MNEHLDARAVAFQLPIGQEEEFRGILDLIHFKMLTFKDAETIILEIPEEHHALAYEYRQQLIEKLADFNEEILNLFLEDKEVPLELLMSAARDATLKLLITPVFCGAAYKNKGITQLLDAVVDYLPSPVDIGAVVGLDVDDPEKARHRNPSPKEPFSALAFKLIHDPYVGQQTFVRVYSGTLKSGMQVMNSTKGKPERVGRILKIRAKDREEVGEAGPGDIVALIDRKSVV